ncbi:CD2 antigen cytoplasmic tail-binding protein 2-like [Durio zibethinus]|uniref:CD2 antigen cytoplasmic tail-binding protein 2-like n=1 Tax=Durio zibethinus TaxID=66656 RepID=A0A6P6AFQ4_DURZI|nr:CD2 antigen cytoplasmic tail-binding protein 2-like [Durio zibethinus]
MEENPPRSHLKRQFLQDEDSNKPPAQKRIRFPKGKKVKPGEEAANRVAVEDGSGDLKDPRLAAKERAKRRNQITTELFTEDGRGMLNDVSVAEVAYEDNENFIDDGIQIEPFNLNKEREEGYFDADGNFVEYINDNEIKDAWLDSVEADIKYTGKTSATTNEDNSEVAAQDLSPQDIGIIKRRIANVLEPGETVLQALRRLKGATNNRKEKMSAEIKHVFDQLTEDAMKLMDNGDYNVYHEKQKVFQREAEGYEKLALARGKGISVNVGLDNSDPNLGSDILTDINYPGVTSSVLPDLAVGTSNSNLTPAEVSSNAADSYDMFADDEGDENLKPSSEPNSNAVTQSSSEAANTFSETGEAQNDYVYDESSGYYYSSTLGYYYDPSTGLYCSAASGQWYSFNEATGTYDEVQEVASSTN